MKVLLFNIADTIPSLEHYCNPPLGLGYIKSYFEKYAQNKDIKVRIQREGIWKILQQDKPDVIGISSITEHYNQAIKYAEKIKQSTSCIVILGGIHISNLPQSLNPVFDVAVLGEGEETTKELLETIHGYGLNKEKFSKIKGLAFYDDGRLNITDSRPLFQNIDILPYPSMENMRIKTFVQMLTARGCPFRCIFCSSASFWGNRIRFHSPAYVVEEMLELILNYKARHISICDDLFAINKQRLSEIARLINKKKKCFSKVTFGITVRADVINEEICKLLKEINVIRVGVGFESGSDRMLKLLKGNSASLEDNRKATEILQKYNFNVHGFFIIGSPYETEKDLIETYNFIINSKLDSGIGNLAIPGPNTEFWRYAQTKGWVSKDMDFRRLSLKDFYKLENCNDFILLSESISRDKIIEIGLKIQRHFSIKNFNALLNPKTLNLRNIILGLRQPMIILPFILNIVKNLFKRQIMKRKYL